MCRTYQEIKYPLDINWPQFWEWLKRETGPELKEYLSWMLLSYNAENKPHSQVEICEKCKALKKKNPCGGYYYCPYCDIADTPIGEGVASRFDEVSIDGNAMRAHSVSLPESSEDKEVTP